MSKGHLFLVITTFTWFSSKYVVLTQINENRGQGGRWVFLVVTFCLLVGSSDLGLYLEQV